MTIKQLRERLKEGEEKVEAVAEVIKDSVNAKLTAGNPKWASTRENSSLGFPTKRVSNQSPQLQRLARELKFHR